MSLPPKLGRRLVAGFVLGMVLYVAIAVWADVGRIAQELRALPLWVPAAACGLSFANYLVRFVRWERYRELLGIDLDRGTSFLIHLAGLALTVTPGKMGEAFKSWLVRRVDGTPIHRSAPIVLAERVTDLFGFLVLIAVGGLGSSPEHRWVFWAALGLVAVAIALLGSPRVARLATAALQRTPVLGRAAPKVEGAFESARVLLAPRELLLPTLLASVGWGLECAGFWLIADALVEGDVPFLFAVHAFALSAVAGAVLVLFPGGLGPTEALLGTLTRREYSGLGIGLDVARSKAAAAVILVRLCTLWFAVVVGLVATAVFTRRWGELPDEPAPDPAPARSSSPPADAAEEADPRGRPS